MYITVKLYDADGSKLNTGVVSTNLYVGRSIDLPMGDRVYVLTQPLKNRLQVDVYTQPAIELLAKQGVQITTSPRTRQIVP